MKPFLATILGVTCFILVARGQYPVFEPGYAVTPSGDTLKGQLRRVQSTKPYNSIEFRKAEGDQIAKLAATGLSAFRQKDKNLFVSRFTTIANEPDTVFLEILATGRLALYKYVRYSVTYLLIEKDHTGLQPLTNETVIRIINGQSVQTRSNRYRYQLGEAFADCLSIKQPLGSFAFHEKPITKLVKQYNACMTDPRGVK